MQERERRQHAPKQPVQAHVESACLARVDGERDGDVWELVGDWGRAQSSRDASLSKVQTHMRTAQSDCLEVLIKYEQAYHQNYSW